MEPTHQWKYEDYNDWSRLLAKNHTKEELETMIYGAKRSLTSATKTHLSAISKTSSMESNSQRRAQSRNNVSGSYEKKYAIENALEIHEYYPQYAKQVEG